MNYLVYEVIGIFAYNIVVALIYGIDKLCAKRGAWRISERALLLFAFLLGGVGSCLGMIWFNHKTAKPKFRFLVPIALILNLVLYFLFFWESTK
ncbi:MAG: DUF1294 domain-containing protein [Clostridia bacterium]|nr:DUF1294 domain-containing protein [Clostridia bacterium]